MALKTPVKTSAKVNPESKSCVIARMDRTAFWILGWCRPYTFLFPCSGALCVAEHHTKRWRMTYSTL